jgi:hypothetical protein
MKLSLPKRNREYANKETENEIETTTYDTFHLELPISFFLF